MKFTKAIEFKSCNKTVVKKAVTFDTNSKACTKSIIVFSVDAVLFALSLVGLKVENEERLTRALIRELGPETLNGIGRLIHEFSEASSAVDKARKMFSILKILYDNHVLQDAISIAKDEMSTWDWIKTGLLAAGQLIAWFATDGAAFIAECALVILSATDLIEDAVKVDKDCKK